ncbi:MAG: hypothetical protein M3Z66_10145 [Chloroflexota bacterium]|nr:hypothetical protein [Chloroflexota bacterium]
MNSRFSWRFLLVPLLVCAALASVLGAANPALAASSARLSRAYAAPGDSVAVYGYGFYPGDDVVVGIDLLTSGRPNRVEIMSRAGPSGGLSATITLPATTTQGTYTVDLRDFHGHQATQPLTVVPLVYLQVGAAPSTTYVIAMHSLYISAAGFGPAEAIHLSVKFSLYNLNTHAVTRNTGSNKSGKLYELAIRIPRDALAGPVTLSATGQSGKKAQAHLIVVYRPSLTLSAQTVRPGARLDLQGHEFVPESEVSVSLTVARRGTTNTTLSGTFLTDVYGAFTTPLDLPTNARLGTYSVAAINDTGGFKAYAPLSISTGPSIVVQPAAVFPGEAIAVSGENFGAGVHVIVSGDFRVPGGMRAVATGVVTGSSGAYSAQLAVPGTATIGTATIRARSSTGQTSTGLQIRPRPTPAPLATVSLPGALALATNTQAATVGQQGFGYRSISVWYHTVHVGAYNHVVVQSALVR